MNEREIICLFPFLQYYEFQKYFNNNKYSPSLFLWKMYSFFLILILFSNEVILFRY